MPTVLNTREWGKVVGLTPREVSHRLEVTVEEVLHWIDFQLVTIYEGGEGIFIDNGDISNLERLGRKYPNWPWERLLWRRFEKTEQASQENLYTDPRSTEQTLVQPISQTEPLTRTTKHPVKRLPVKRGRWW